jgi:molecular chaperone GrpE
MSNNSDNKWEDYTQEHAEEKEENVKSSEDSGADIEIEDDFADTTEVKKESSPKVDLQLAAVTELENTIKALQLELEGMREQTARALAEVDNTRRRAERDVSDAHRYGSKKILTEMLPVLDSLVRSQEGVDETNEQLKPMLDGIRLTLELFENALAKFGFAEISPQRGDAFDPDRHEAMSLLPDAELDKNSVINVVQKGYELNGRVLRAAMVIVSQ